ncbi:MAG: CAP domain-containing protein [Planctomycetota bacterium]
MSRKIVVLFLTILLFSTASSANAQCPCRKPSRAAFSTSSGCDLKRGGAKIIVPFDAKVSVDGRELGGFGPVRWYQGNPAVDANRLSLIRGTWTDRVTGEKRSYERKILVRPGSIRPVNLCGDSLEAIAKGVVERSNRHRKANGVGPLMMSNTLAAAAQKHADAMARRKTLAHQLDGRGFVDRAQDEGYSFLAGAENIAEGAWSSEHVVEMWMRSPGHRKNLLSGDYTEIGIGTAWAEDGTRFDVQVFGRPAMNRIASK